MMYYNLRSSHCSSFYVKGEDALGDFDISAGRKEGYCTKIHHSLEKYKEEEKFEKATYSAFFQSGELLCEKKLRHTHT